MEVLEIDLQKQLIFVVLSCILGLIFGAAYDIIRIVHILCRLASYSGERRGMREGVAAFWAVFVLDALTMLVFGAAFSVFVYAVNDGQFRWFLGAGAAAGFALYHATVGRVVMFFSEKIAAGLRWLFRTLILRPLTWLGHRAGRLIRFVGRATVGRLIRGIRRIGRDARTRRHTQALQKDLRF